MSGALHGAEGDDSKGPNAARASSGIVLTVRLVLAALGLAGAVLLLVASFATVIEITVGTTSKVIDADTAQSGWDRHGPALILLGLLALFLLFAGLRGARVALTGLIVVGVASLAIAWAWDRPHVHDTGSVGDVYADATADPGTGYYLETLGGALLLLVGGSLLVFGRTSVPSPAPDAPDAPSASGSGSAEERSRARRARRAASAE
jgi:hypothetical protein